MMLVSTVLGQRCLPICLSSSMFPLHQQKGRLEKSATFYTFTKIGDKNCKVTVDSGSCINAISSSLCENLGLEIIPYLHAYKVSWIDSTALEVKQRCLVPISFNNYKGKIWCDVITMNVGQVMQGKP